MLAVNTPGGVSACGSAHLGAQPTILEADLLPLTLRMTLTPTSQAMMSELPPHARKALSHCSIRAAALAKLTTRRPVTATGPDRDGRPLRLISTLNSVSDFPVAAAEPGESGRRSAGR